MFIIYMSFCAGVIGMGFGGLISAVFGSGKDKIISIFLSSAGGVMISIVFFELIPKAMESSNIFVTLMGMLVGCLMVWGLNNFADKISDAKKIQRSGMIMLFAIALHNIPEGLAMGAAGIYDPGLGLTLAIIITLHNIPEGMAVSAPLIAGGLSKTKSVGLTLLAGATTTIGAVIGVLVGSISDIAVAVSFSVAGGAMLYVVLGEILPQAIVTNKNRMPTAFVLAGIIFGILCTQI